MPKAPQNSNLRKMQYLYQLIQEGKAWRSLAKTEMPPYYHRIIRALKAISVPFSFVPLNTGMSMQFWSSFKKNIQWYFKIKTT